jgi:hypothetical protein
MIGLGLCFVLCLRTPTTRPHQATDLHTVSPNPSDEDKGDRHGNVRSVQGNREVHLVRWAHHKGVCVLAQGQVPEVQGHRCRTEGLRPVNAESATWCRAMHRDGAVRRVREGSAHQSAGTAALAMAPDGDEMVPDNHSEARPMSVRGHVKALVDGHERSLNWLVQSWEWGVRATSMVDACSRNWSTTVMALRCSGAFEVRPPVGLPEHNSAHKADHQDRPPTRVTAACLGRGCVSSRLRPLRSTRR